MTITIVNADLLTEDQYVSGFVGCVEGAWDWYKRYLETEGASPTRFFKLVKAQCDERGIECPVKLKTLQNKAGIWRRDGDVPPAKGKGLEGGRGSASYRLKQSNPDSGFPVENSKPKSNAVNPEEVSAFNEMTEVLEATMNENQSLLNEVAELRNQLSTLSENDEPQSIRQQQQLEDSSGLALVEISTESGMDPHTPPPINYDWHPGVQMDSEERRDIIRIGRLVDEIGAIQKKYAFTGKLGPREWEQIYGGLQAVSAVANAQRRYRPGSAASRVIDIG